MFWLLYSRQITCHRILDLEILCMMKQSENRMATTDEILARIDKVLRENKSLTIVYILMSVTLFILGITAIAYALYTGNLIYTAPSAFTSLFLAWPIQSVIKLREKNIALATVPILISTLPKAQAAEEIQKLIEKLYG